MAANVTVNDVGTNFIGTVYDEQSQVQDISESYSMQMVFRRPDGTSITKTAVFLTDGTDGKMKCTTVIGDINQIGRWQVQGVVTNSNGVFYSDISKFKVSGNL